MNPRPRRPAPSPSVTRHFEFTRFHEQLIESAYLALIPVVARPLRRPRPHADADGPASAPIVRLRSQDRGA